MKRTLKAQQAYLKETNGLFSILSFENGKRHSSYMGLGIIQSFEEIAKRTAEGRQILIILESSEMEISRYETKNKCRAPYEWVKQFVVSLDYNGIWK